MITETILGGLTGFFGNIITSVANYKMQKLTNEQQRFMAEIDLKKMDKEKEIMLAEAEANMRITEVETEAQMDISDSQAYLESIKQAEKQGLSDAMQQKLLDKGGFASVMGVVLAFFLGLVDLLKSIVRPGLTLYLMGLTTYITILAWNVLDAKKDVVGPEQAQKIFENVTTIVIYLTVSCVTWWFGDRRMAKFLTRLDDGNFKNQASMKSVDAAQKK
jgi:hypothetical protein